MAKHYPGETFVLKKPMDSVEIAGMLQGTVIEGIDDELVEIYRRKTYIVRGPKSDMRITLRGVEARELAKNFAKLEASDSVSATA